MASRLFQKRVLITGASAGIGRAMALEFAAAGASLALGARRTESLETLSAEIKQKFGTPVFTHALDVGDTASVAAFVGAAWKALGGIEILVNNAGLALGTDSVADGKESDWQTMLNTNVNGLLRVSREVIRHWPTETPDSGVSPYHVINLGSVAGYYAYEGGSAYVATKHAVRGITQVLRLELQGRAVRVSEIDPGMVETDFSVTRFSGDGSRAKKVYEGMQTLVADDIARIAVFIAGQPPHVNIDQLVVTPVAQAGLKVLRRP